MGEVFKSGEVEEAMEEINVVMEEELDGCSSFVIKEEEYYSETRLKKCLVCKDEYTNAQLVDIMVVNTTTSEVPAAYIISTMMMKRSSQDVTFNNTSMCKACFQLLDRADELQAQMDKIKEELGEIKTKFRKNLNVASQSTSQTSQAVKKEATPKRSAGSIKKPASKLMRKETPDTKPVEIFPEEEEEEIEVSPNDLSLWGMIGDEEEESSAVPSTSGDKSELWVMDESTEKTADTSATTSTPSKRSKRLVFSNSTKTGLITNCKGYKCPECGIEIQHKSTFDTHLRTAHNTSTTVKCQLCLRQFTTEKEMNRHMKRCHSSYNEHLINEMMSKLTSEDVYLYFVNTSSDYKCKFCFNQVFSTQGEFYNHFNEVHLIYSRITCNLCSEHFTNNINEYLIHMSAFHPGNKFLQGSAQLSVIPDVNIPPTSNEADMNMNPNKEDHMFPCIVCNAVFSKRDLLLQHRRCHKGGSFAKNNKITRYHCPLCDGDFSHGRIKYHINDYHTLFDRVKCDLCPEEFNKYYLLNTHKRTHHSFGKITKKHKCSICLKMFSCPKDVRVHITAVHRREKSYVCDVCGQAYKTRRGFYEHKLRHKGEEKRFRCKICHKYYAGNVIRNHVRKVHKIMNAPRINDPFRFHLAPFEKVELNQL